MLKHMIYDFDMIRRSFVLGAPSLVLGGCFDTPCEEENSAQKAFLDGLKSLAKPALASNNPLQVEEAAKQSVLLAEKVGAFTGWCGTLTRVEGNAENVSITVDVGRQVSLYAFNDWALAFAGSVAASRYMARTTPSMSSMARPSGSTSTSLATKSVSRQLDWMCSVTRTGPAMVRSSVSTSPRYIKP